MRPNDNEPRPAERGFDAPIQPRLVYMQLSVTVTLTARRLRHLHRASVVVPAIERAPTAVEDTHFECVGARGESGRNHPLRGHCLLAPRELRRVNGDLSDPRAG